MLDIEFTDGRIAARAVAGAGGAPPGGAGHPTASPPSRSRAVATAIRAGSLFD